MPSDTKSLRFYAVLSITSPSGDKPEFVRSLDFGDVFSVPQAAAQVAYAAAIEADPAPEGQQWTALKVAPRFAPTPERLYRCVNKHTGEVLGSYTLAQIQAKPAVWRSSATSVG